MAMSAADDLADKLNRCDECVHKPTLPEAHVWCQLLRDKPVGVCLSWETAGPEPGRVMSEAESAHYIRKLAVSVPLSPPTFEVEIHDRARLPRRMTLYLGCTKLVQPEVDANGRFGAVEFSDSGARAFDGVPIWTPGGSPAVPGESVLKHLTDAWTSIVKERDRQIKALIREVRYLRHYGNKDCTHMADAAMARGDLER